MKIAAHMLQKSDTRSFSQYIQSQNDKLSKLSPEYIAITNFLSPTYHQKGLL